MCMWFEFFGNSLVESHWLKSQESWVRVPSGAMSALTMTIVWTSCSKTEFEFVNVLPPFVSKDLTACLSSFTGIILKFTSFSCSTCPLKSPNKGHPKHWGGGWGVVFQWLRRYFSNSRGTGLTLVRELRSHMPHGPKNKTENRSNTINKFNKDFKHGPH